METEQYRHQDMDRYPNQRSGMTLVEIMIVTMIILLLAGIAMPALMKARHSAQNAQFISDLRVAFSVFQQQSFQPGGLPANAAAGVIPDGMSEYLRRINWDEDTPITGQWDWEPAANGFGDGIRVENVTVSDDRMRDIDKRLDDNNLASGSFQKVSSGIFIYLLE